MLGVYFESIPSKQQDIHIKWFNRSEKSCTYKSQERKHESKMLTHGEMCDLTPLPDRMNPCITSFVYVTTWILYKRDLK